MGLEVKVRDELFQWRYTWSRGVYNYVTVLLNSVNGRFLLSVYKDRLLKGV